MDQGALGRGSPDIERKDIGLADQLAELGGAPDAGGRAGFHHGDRNAGRGIDGVDAAIGLHDVQGARKTEFPDARVQPLQIAFGDGLHIRGQNRGVRALVFPPFARDLVRCNREDFRPEALDLRLHRQFVARVRIGMEQADRDRLHAFRPEILQDPGNGREVQRLQLLTAVGHPPRHLPAQVAGHERWRLLVVQVEEIRPVPSCNLQHVAEALGRDQADGNALSFRQRIDHDGCAMRQEIDLGWLHPGLCKHVEHADLEVRWSGVGLGRVQFHLAGFQIRFKADEVGKGSAHIGCDAGDFSCHGSLLHN